eukprot:TRINITY_DN51147_c0_g1_i1.p2 TRINITY_DN51147_c0_g1~~TRINITY_DN51147_c0_g1_i1.p2  ORF type:complete len:132 (-),score=41.59 TRINITY_DN51147_c0_g1_i1:375-770(-)
MQLAQSNIARWRRASTAWCFAQWQCWQEVGTREDMSQADLRAEHAVLCRANGELEAQLQQHREKHAKQLEINSTHLADERQRHAKGVREQAGRFRVRVERQRRQREMAEGEVLELEGCLGLARAAVLESKV